MTILVFSDSHGGYTNMEKAVALHPDAKMIIFLGRVAACESLSDISHLSMKKRMLGQSIRFFCGL